MKTKNLLLITIIMVCVTTVTFAQTFLLGNGRPPAPVFQLGWDGLGPNAGDLQIRNDFAVGVGNDINLITLLHNGINLQT